MCMEYYTESGGPYYMTFNMWINSRIEFHRENGPALTFDYDTDRPICHHYLNGKLHRDDGPCSYILNSTILGYCLHGVEYSFEEYYKVSKCTDQQWMELKLIYGSL